MIPRTKTMRWATPTPSRTICMHARLASNLSLLAMTAMTSSYQSYGHLKKIFTYRRSNWDLRGDPGTRRYKVSGLLIIVEPKKYFGSCFKSKYRWKNLKWSLHANVTSCFPSVINCFFCMGSFYLLFFYHCLLLSFLFAFLPPSTLVSPAVEIRCWALQMTQTVMSVLGSLLSPRLLAPLSLTHSTSLLTPPSLWGKGPYSCTTVRVKECLRASGVYWVLMLGLNFWINGKLKYISIHLYFW